MKTTSQFAGHDADSILEHTFVAVSDHGHAAIFTTTYMHKKEVIRSVNTSLVLMRLSHSGDKMIARVTLTPSAEKKLRALEAQRDKLQSDLNHERWTILSRNTISQKQAFETEASILAEILS